VVVEEVERGEGREESHGGVEEGGLGGVVHWRGGVEEGG
jgi:hypothetical protein